MITQYISNQSGLLLESDLAGEFPLYLFWPQNKSTLLYSTSIIELLNDARVPKPLKVSSEGISFLLQSGVVPPPKTAYQDIYILGIGDKAQVSTQNGKVDVAFSHQFPFMNANRLATGEMQPDEDLILQMLAEATTSRIAESKPSFLFHSAGKDSNSIALALAEAGWQDKITLITHKSKGKADESEISAKIAKQLGFKHQILHEVDQLKAEHYQAIENYFINAPFPCVDGVTLAYPIYSHQQPELRGANIIDGMGNDVYMTRDITKRLKLLIPPAQFISDLSFLRKYIKSESIFNPLLRTSAEWTGMSGLSLKDSNKIFKKNISVYDYWSRESKIRKKWDIYDFKSDLGTPISSEMFTRKARNFADSIQSNLILPFANQQISEYFGRLPEVHLFDRKNQKNKIIIRKILQERIGLDSDALGKMGYIYDFKTVVDYEWENMVKTIESCALWSSLDMKALINRYLKYRYGNSRSALNAKSWVYRLYLISSWHSKSKYINK